MRDLELKKMDNLISRLWKQVPTNPFALIAISKIQEKRDAIAKEPRKPIKKNGDKP